MQQMHDLAERPGHGRPRLGLGRFVRAGEDRLGEFDVPVAEGAPGELIERARRLVELELVDSRGDARGRVGERTCDPAIDREAGAFPVALPRPVAIGYLRLTC